MAKPRKPTEEQQAETPQEMRPAQMEQELSGDDQEGMDTFAQTNPTEAQP